MQGETAGGAPVPTEDSSAAGSAGRTKSDISGRNLGLLWLLLRESPTYQPSDLENVELVPHMQRVGVSSSSFERIPPGIPLRCPLLLHVTQGSASLLAGSSPGAVQACLDGQLSNLSRASHTPCKAMMKPGTS